jgi:hypothetical protein
LLEAIQAHLPIVQINVPDILGLLNPIYDRFSDFSLEISQILQELQSFQLMNTLKAMIDPMLSVVGLAVDEFLPKLPGLGLTLVDLLTMSPATIYQKVRDAIAEYGIEAFEAILPVPIFLTMSIPAIEIVTIVKMLKQYYITMVVTKVEVLVNQVTSILQIPGMPALPSIPTLADIKALAFGLFPDAEQLIDILKTGISVSSLFSMFSLPGIPVLNLPEPLFPKLSSFDIEINEALVMLRAHMNTVAITSLVSFVEEKLSILNIEFPTFCINI